MSYRWLIAKSTPSTRACLLFALVVLVISSIFEEFAWTPLAWRGVALVLIDNVLVVGRGPGARRRIAAA